jgi:DNA-binding NarL/FixJ family response regulator
VIRVLLVDDHLSFRQPLAFMLQREPDIDVVGEAGSLAEACEVPVEVDMALVDLDLPDGNGATLIRTLRAANPRCMVAVLSASGNRTDLAQAVEAGAVGILHKSHPIESIVAALRRLQAGEHLISPTETVELLRLVGQQREKNRAAEAAIRRLTRRECDVLQSLADGLSDREIAERLVVSTETVRTHMVNLLHKLGVESRLQALVFALRHGVVRID